jgi:pilus assembly protein CpaF
MIHGLGENVSTHWAPSLKHRDDHHPDPPEYKDEWSAFEEKLKSDARAKNADANKVQVQVPAGPTPASQPKPASRPSMPAQPRPPVAGKDDATPPPTKNPLLAKAPPPPAADSTGEHQAHGQSIQMSDSLEEEAIDKNSTQIKENPLNAPRPARPNPPSGGAARPPIRPPVKR